MTFLYQRDKLKNGMDFELRGDKAMKIRNRKWLPVLALVLLTIFSFQIFAQETNDEEMKSTDSTQQAVPPDVSKKAKEYKGSPSPPKNLIKQEDGHWTPYNPPPIKDGDYIIQSGDTLSVLSQNKLGNWLLWPTIWDMNPYILDAHWIYPGDPLTMPEAPKVIGEELEEEEEEFIKTGERFIIEEEAPLPPINAKDVYCSGFITDRFKMPSLRIASAQARIRESFGEGDIVYLNEGNEAGVIAGMEYFIISQGPPIYHSVSGKYMGRLYEKVGKLKVLCVRERTSIAKITLSCDEIKYGMALLPFSPIPIPWTVKATETLPLCYSDTGKIKGRIIWSDDRIESNGLNSIVYADLGANQRILPGDKFWIYRYSTGEDTLVNSINDLFKQQRVDVAEKDLFRSDVERRGKFKNPNKNISKKRDSRFPQNVSLESSKDSVMSELEVKKGDSRMPSNVRRQVIEPNEGISSIRKYVGEAVVLTTQGETSCLKVIVSSEEIKLGDTIELE